MCACIHVRRREDGEKLSKVLLFQQHGGFMCWHQHIFHFIFQPKFLWLFAHIHAFTWCHYRNERMAWQEKTTSSRDETIAKTERKSLCTNVIESLQWGRWRQAQQQREEKKLHENFCWRQIFLLLLLFHRLNIWWHGSFNIVNVCIQKPKRAERKATLPF